MPDNKAEQQKLNRARAEIAGALGDTRYIAVNTSQDVYAARRAKELVNVGNGGLDDVRRVLIDLRNDFTMYATATGNSTAIRRRDSLATLLENF
jgi:outer membrane lipoprotein SlyB